MLRYSKVGAGDREVNSPAMDYGWLYTKTLEKEKIKALVYNGSDYEKLIDIPATVLEDLSWWEGNLGSGLSLIKKGNFQLEIFSDTGWGATDGKRNIFGFWTEEQRVFHINYKELLAVWFALENLAGGLVSCQVLLRVDNTTAISYVNKMGATKIKKYLSLARRLGFEQTEGEFFFLPHT